MYHFNVLVRASVLLVSFAYGAGGAWAEDPTGASPVEIVVTPNRTETPLREVASSVSVITAADIKEKGSNSVVDVLHDIPGVDVVQSGGPGGNAAVFIRGANADHTLVLIDGIEANNPISPNRAFNFADLSVDDIERIEVLRGPQSTLYGSDALGGVIQIITKKGTKKTIVGASAEAGSYDSYTETAHASGGNDLRNFSFSASQRNVHSFSAADKRDGNSEADAYANSSFAGRVGVTPAKDLEGALFLRYNDAHTNLDNSAGAGGDDPNRLLKNQEIFTRGEVRNSFFDETLKQIWFGDYTEHRLDDDNDPDPAHPLDSQRSHYNGGLFKYGLENALRLTSYLSLLGGVENAVERGSSLLDSDSAYGPYTDQFYGKSQRTTGYFGQASLSLCEAFHSTFGVRLDDNSAFGTHATWRVAPTYYVSDSGTKFSASVGTGFKAPSLYQLYSPYGDPTLLPEKSLGIDAGVSQSFLGESVTLGVTYFWNRFDNLVTFNPATFVLENSGGAHTQGIEASSEYEISKAWQARGTFTYTDTSDDETGQSLLRRARLMSSARLSYKEEERWGAHAEVLAVGSRPDNDYNSYPPTRTTLAGYALLNVGAFYGLSRNVELYVRAENLLDKKYQEVLGYGTAGATGYIGVKVRM